MGHPSFFAYLFASYLAASAVCPISDAAPAPGDKAILMLRGLRSAEAVAVNAQGSPMVASATTGGGIAHVLGRGSSKVLAETSGTPAGLAFDANGDLYVADRSLCEIFKVTPWGHIQLVAENFGSPEGIAVGPDGSVYLADSQASRVYRIGPQGDRSTFAADLYRPRGIVVSADGRHIFISDGKRKVWRFSTDGTSRTQFAEFADEGLPAGMALDEQGNLYVARDGGGKVSVRSAAGEPVAEYAIPGRRVTAVAFGGYDLKTLFVTEAEAGALYAIRVLQRSQRLLWEPNQPLRIINPPDGAILNRHDGEQTKAGLRIQVKGLASAGGPVRVNDIPAAVRGGEFQGAVMLDKRENRITVTGPNGTRDEITVIWDRDSYPRYRFSTDDNIWFLRDIQRNAQTYTSIFQNPYLAFWRQMHLKYGMKIHHNIYYETSGFNLSQMPDKFRDEWRANAHWMRLSFHARANDPARPYAHASAEQIRDDYLAVTREIVRFAGSETLSTAVTTIHWGAVTRAAAAALRKEGVRILLGADVFHDDLPYVGYHLSIAQMHDILGRDYWKDTREDLILLHHDLVVNAVPLDGIVPHLERIALDPHESEVMELIIHEQYFYPDYRSYEPDFRERVERALEWVTRRGYKPVFFGDGFLGCGPQ